MADIKQAAKWLEEGKRVWRPMLAKEISIGTHGQWLRVFVNGEPRRDAVLCTDDLIADDWELAD